MSYKELDENLLMQMYNDPETTVKEIQKHFGISSGVVYRHLKANGIDSNRKTSILWTDVENAALIKYRKEGLTGAELCEKIPTRSPVSIKSHVQKLRILKLIR